jgi:hypothetical protein
LFVPESIKFAENNRYEKSLRHHNNRFIFLRVGITNSCSQSASSAGLSTYGLFEATTPCDDEAKKILGISPGFKCEMIKWNLTFYNDPNKNTPTSFHLICVYGMAKQGTRGFMDGATTIELKGKCVVEKEIQENTNPTIYNLIADNLPTTISFLQADQNIFHLLNENKKPMNGNGAWSYTLNRKQPIITSSNRFTLQATPSLLPVTDSDTVGIFGGRTPCNSVLREINNISAEGCQIIKCRLTLLQDKNTRTPDSFLLETIYVGKGDNRYSTKGKWKLLQDVAGDPAAIVYQLEPDPGNPKTQLLLLKADDNILFFLDNNAHFLVGNDYCSYTLNNVRKR